MNKLKDKLTLILTALTIISMLSGMGVFKYARSLKEKAVRYEKIIHQKEVTYKDDLGREVKEKTQIEVKYQELKKAYKKDSALRNEFEQKLAEIYSENKALKKRNRSLVQASTISMETNFEYEADLIEQPVFDTIPEKLPIKTSFVEGPWYTVENIYNPNTDKLYGNVQVRNELFVSLNREKEWDNGKEINIPRIIFWKPWQYAVSIKTMNDSTQVLSFENIKIK